MKKKESFTQLKQELETIIAAMEDPSSPFETLEELYKRGDKIASQLEAALSSSLEVTVKKIKS